MAKGKKQDNQSITPIKTTAGNAQNIQTPVTKKRAQSDGSSNSSNLLVGVSQNQDILIFVEVVKTTNTGRSIILISISDNRPPTALGNTQGDHVTAYKSFLEMLASAMQGRNIKNIPKYLNSLAVSILPDKKDKFNVMLKILNEKVSKVVTKSQQDEAIRALKAKKIDPNTIENTRALYKSARIDIYKDVVRLMGQVFLQEVNLDEATAFKKEGQSDKTEGARVKKAIHALKAVDDLLSIDDADNKQLNYFYENYIKTGAPYKDGANAIFGEKAVKILDKSWSKLGSKDKRNKIKGLYNDNVVDKIADFFGDLFDFQYQKHKDRLDVPTLLYEVTAKRIIIMFHAFEKLQNIDNNAKDKIIDKFLKDKVLENQGWRQFKIKQGKKKTELTLDILKLRLNNYANLEEFRILSEQERLTLSQSRSQQVQSK